MAVNNRVLRLLSLVTYVQSEMDGDEVFIKYHGKKIAPAKKKYYKMTREPLELNVDIKLGNDEWVELELWEYDVLLPNDFLGKFRLQAGQQRDTFSTELMRANESKAQYVLHWELLTNVKEKKGTAVK